MPQPPADLLQQMPHPGEDKVVQCLTNAKGGGGMRNAGIDGAINLHQEIWPFIFNSFSLNACELTLRFRIMLHE